MDHQTIYLDEIIQTVLIEYMQLFWNELEIKFHTKTPISNDTYVQSLIYTYPTKVTL